MSLLSACEPLQCKVCPFVNGSRCFLDIRNVQVADTSYPPNCPLLDQRKVTIWVEQGHLYIGRDYD